MKGLRRFCFRHKTPFALLFLFIMTIRAYLPLCRYAFLFLDMVSGLAAAIPVAAPRPLVSICQLSTQKSKLEDTLMKEINLRDYYPFYTTDMIVEVPDEVADLLYEYKLSEAAHFLRTYRHKAYFSLDYDENVERDALVIVLTPAEILEQEEENARLYRAVAMLPEKQRSRISAHFFLGMSLSEIAKSENSAPSSVHEGIQRGLRRLKKILEEI